MNAELIYDELIKSMKQYHPSNDFSLIEKAYAVATKAHGNQLRRSGEPYMIHPLSVANILAWLELDMESIAAAILHDVIEDTVYSYTDITGIFGQEIADLVEGVTKIDKIEYFSEEEAQAENYRKMFLAMAKDIRVIIIKIADRLHNMRTLKHMPEQNQKKTAQETLDIYSPLAHRLGISKIRYELEDLSFRYLNPDAYYDLAEKIKLKQSERIAFVDDRIAELRARLHEYNIDGIVDGRPKHFFSIYKKMIGKEKTLDQIYDLFALRVMVDTQNDCYVVLGIAHEMYKAVPGRFKDYINMPKANMYQSLHNTLLGPEGEPFELQIRTHEMHRVAEYGIAAHWKYKSGGKTMEESENYQEAKLTWLRQILDTQRELSDNKEYLDALKLDLNVFRDHVYCFTPKGKVISLLSGSTPVDFAYAVHSAVGNKMVGARVNNRMTTIDYVLKSGDIVEIITSQNSKGPSHDWLKLVKTSQARNKINNWFRKENRDDNIQKGKELLDKDARKKGLSLSELLTPEKINIVLNKYSYVDWDSLCASVGFGGIREGQIINRLYEEYEKQNIKIPDTIQISADIRDKKPSKKSGITVKGVGDISVRFSKCCSPVPGDEIVGFVTRGRGVSVHRTDCVNIVGLDEINRNRLLPAEWAEMEVSDKLSFQAEIKVICDTSIGMLNQISRLLADEKINVTGFNARTSKDEGIVNIIMCISNKLQLEKINHKLLNIKGIYEIERVTT